MLEIHGTNKKKREGWKKQSSVSSVQTYNQRYRETREENGNRDRIAARSPGDFHFLRVKSRHKSNGIQIPPFKFQIRFFLGNIPAEHSAYIQSPLFDQNSWSIWHGTSHLLSFVPSFSGFVLPLRLPMARARLWRISTTLLNLRHAGSMAVFALPRPEKKKGTSEKNGNEAGRWVALLDLARNESSENGRVLVDHKKRITGAPLSIYTRKYRGETGIRKTCATQPACSSSNEISRSAVSWIRRTIIETRRLEENGRYLECSASCFDILEELLRIISLD